VTGDAGVAGALSVANEDCAHLGLFLLLYIPGMIGAPFLPESFGSEPRSAAASGAKGSLDAELAETILAESGMETWGRAFLGLWTALWVFGCGFPVSASVVALAVAFCSIAEGFNR